MEPASKATLDDGHGRTRIEWIVPPTVDSSPTPSAATPSGRYDLSELDKLPASRAVRVMLRNAAEIEHQLFLEYLYASSSLKDPRAAGIVGDIAVEEMGHLLTVNNLLVAMDGDPYFGRGPDVPVAGSNDPFEFKLRAASQATLAMFTAAESPEPKALRSWWARLELRLIFAVARTPQVQRVQRVGALYEHIVKKMKEPSIDAGFASAAQYFPIQASPLEAWASAGVSRHMIVERISNGGEAISALVKIMAQGEGPLNDANSHFVRFRRVLRFMLLGRYSRDFHALEPGTQAGVSPVSSPTPVSRALAQLLDVRYQLLLVRLYQIFAPNPDAARRIRIGCSLREMRFVIAPLTDAIRAAVAAGGGCPALFTLPAYFDPHTRSEQQSRQASLLRDTEALIKELQALMPSSGALGGVAATIQDLEGVLATVP